MSTMMPKAVSETTPVLVGVGLATQRQSDPTLAQEPLELMVAAAESAIRDCAAPDLRHQIDAVYVPRGRWRYQDPGRAIAGRIGVRGAHSVLARVGVLQEQLMGTACQRISEGEIDAALIVGGDAGFRLLRARIAGHELVDSQQDSAPDEVWRASNAIMTEAEMAGGLGKDAAPYYAVLDSAFRHRHDRDLATHRSTTAEIYSNLSRVASENPHAWRRSMVAAADIRDASPTNPMLAFPYTKMHTSDWSVDQASALLLCSARTAADHGVPPQRWVYPMATAVSNHMTPVTERATLGRSPGAEIAARHALDHTGLRAAQLDHIDLYSCFPVAVLSHAEAVGVAPDRPLSVSGGMRFAGGPFNNYVLHTTAQLAERLRARPGSTGLVSSVSGVLTKHAFSVWSSPPFMSESPSRKYHFADVTDEVNRATETKPLDPHHCGGGTVAGYTVVYDRGQLRHGVAVIDTDEGRRALARTDDSRVVAELTEVEFTGRRVHVENGRFVPQAAHGSPR